MSKQSDAQKPAALDPFEAGRQWLEIAEKAQKVMTHFVDRQLSGPGPEAMPVTADPMAISRLFTSVLSDPARLGYAQFNFWQRHAELWQRLMKADKTEQPQTKDRRFRSEEWQRDIAFNTLMHTYLIGADWLRSLLTNRSDLPVADQKKLAFFAEQLIDATAPTNFALTNPDVVRKTLETGGANLLNGFSNLLDDLASDAGHVRRADQEAFELGVSIAATKGSVVLRTDMMELIQYEPTTEKVCKIPLLLLPPWVNKYYLFDLQPKSSFIKWAVDQGFTVFAISWVNPDASHARKDFEDYWLEGPQTAFEAIEKATGQKKVNLFGYCLGGTLTAAGLAYLAGRGDDRVSSATMAATMTDFSDFGDFEVFVNADNVGALDSKASRKGYVESADLSRLFSLLRANDLIWSSAISSYLLAEKAVASDLLYWFSDGIGMPAKMLDTFQREILLENALTKPDRLRSGDADRRKEDQDAALLRFSQGRPRGQLGADLRVRPVSRPRNALFWAAQDTTPAQSIHRLRTSTATGPTTPFPPSPANGWKRPNGMRALGRPNGHPG